MHFRKLALVFLFTLFIVSEANSSDQKHDIAIELMAASSSETDGMSATVFGLALASWLNDEENNTSIKPGIYKPTFNAFMSAYSTQIKIWKQLKEKNDPNSEYMNNLISISDSGYLKEYILVNHADIMIGEVPSSTKIIKYNTWAKSHIKNHDSRVEARLRIK